MAAPRIERCYSCWRDVSTRKEIKQRRLLSSGTMQAVLHDLESFIQKLQGDLEVEATAMSNGFICRPCVRLMERYQYLCEEIAGNVAKAIPFLPVGRGMFV